MRILIIGGTSVSGTAAITAARKLGHFIITTTSRDSDVASADATIRNIDLDNPQAIDSIIQSPIIANAPIDKIIYIPARGEVGIAVEESTATMVNKSLDYCVRPYLRLHKALKPSRTIALSGFITMPALMQIYGAMTFTKIAMEELAVKYPKDFQIIRIGMFYSNSVRGIAILAQRRFSREPDFNREWYNEWKQSGKKFPDFFYDKNYRCEEDTYRAHSGGIKFAPTVEKDLEDGFRIALEGEKAPIINVLGPWRWVENAMPPLPEKIASRLHFIPEDVKSIST